jgi:magnesium transporter
MNLSRLLTHPQRFVNPTNDILLEESEEAELLVDCHLWEGTVLANELKLLGKEADRSEKDLSIHLDSLRNRLLYINTLVTVAGLVVAVGSLIAGIFGVNTPFVLMNDPTAFRRIWIPTALLMILSFILLSRWLYLASTSDASWKKIVLKGTFNKIRK